MDDKTLSPITGCVLPIADLNSPEVLFHRKAQWQVWKI